MNIMLEADPNLEIYQHVEEKCSLFIISYTAKRRQALLKTAVPRILQNESDAFMSMLSMTVY